MAAKTTARPKIMLHSTAGTGYSYTTRKNRLSDPERMTLRKYDPIARRIVEFTEKA